MKLSIVVPSYNGASVLEELCREITDKVATAFEILIVDDGSTVRPLPVILKLRNEGIDIKGIFLKYNYGQQWATLAGLYCASGDYIITADDDLSHNPEYFDDMLKKAEEEGLDAVFAVPSYRDSGTVRRAGSRIRDGIFTLCFQKPRRISVSSFRLIKRTIVEAIIKNAPEYRYLSVEILRHTVRIGNMAVTYKSRDSETRYNLLDLFKLGFSLLGSSHYIPARIRPKSRAGELEYTII